MKFLIADSDVDYAQKVAEALEQFGSSDLAENGTVAFRSYTNALKSDEPYDVMFLAADMPMRDGFEATHSINTVASSVGAQARVVILAEEDNEDIRERAKNAGVIEILIKPKGFGQFRGFAEKLKSSLEH